MGLQVADDLRRCLFRYYAVIHDMQFGRLWRLIGGVDPRKVPDLPITCAPIQAFGVTLLTGGKRSIDKYLDEVVCLHTLPYDIAVDAKGGDEGRQRDHARIDEQPRHLPDAANVLDPVLVGKTEVAVQAMAHVIAIKQIRALTHRMQFFLHQAGNGGLARTAQTREPEQACSVAIETLTM